MLKTLQSLWHSYSYIGIDATLSRPEARKVRLVNQILALIIPVQLMLITVNLLIGDWRGAVFVSIFMGIMAMGVVFNYFRWHQFSRWFLFSFLSLMVAFLAWVYGPGIGIEGPFIVICMATVLIFDGKTWYQFMLIVLIVGVYIVTQWSFTSYAHPLEDELSPIAFYAIYLCSLIGGYFLLRTYFQYTSRYEEQLQELLENLEEKNEALKAANEDLDRFATVASHDLKTPLRNITSFLGLIERRLEPEAKESIQQYLDIAKTNARHMYYLVEDILEYSRLDSNTQSKEVNLVELALQVRNTILPTLENPHSLVIVRSLPNILGISSHIEMLFQNLIENAFKYNTSDSPELEISAKENKKWVIIRFKDNGIGIPEAYQAQVFDMFSRLHTQNEYPGTGIGLAICQKIVQNHKGEIRIAESSSKGTTLEVRFPKATDLEKKLHEVPLDLV